MNKKYAFCLAGCVALLINSSCYKQLDEVEEIPPIQYEVEQNMEGKWSVASKDAAPVPTNDKFIVTYEKSWKSYRSQSNPSSSMNWMNKAPFSCSVYDNQITEKSGNLTYLTTVKEIAPREIHALVAESNGEQSASSHLYVYRRVEKDFSSDVIGLWEGKQATPGIPDSTDHRWEFRADGTFVFYNLDVESGAWMANPDKSANYVVDGNWMALRREDPAIGEIRECWDVSVENGQMYWIALRVDALGGRYNQQMQLSKVTLTE